MKALTMATVLAFLMLVAPDAARALEKWQTLPTPPPLPPAERSGYAPVNGIEMYYAVYGKGAGAPLLLIPIGMAAADMWAALIPTLAQRHTVVVADTRGHGRSTRTAEPYSYDLLSADYLALLDYLRIEKVALVGASDGAIIGLDIAIHHPERLSKLFAQGANATTDGIYSDAADPTASKAASRLWESDYRRLSRTPDEYDAFHKAMNRMWDSEPNYSVAQLAGIRTPTAIVICDRDEWIKPKHAQYLARTIPGARTIVLHDVSHYAALQDPAAYAQAVLAFADH
ncbi:MAG TPA: alpha/beta fold hydrolase [Steroidobacteraceae bacterium]|nr:alpha/beta fold hydrolase [Steroidobacteraceae bacterium]